MRPFVFAGGSSSLQRPQRLSATPLAAASQLFYRWSRQSQFPFAPSRLERPMQFSDIARDYRRVAILVMVLALHTLIGSRNVGAADAVSGKYCIDKGSTMLLTRPGANGSLEFGISSWNARGNYFSVYGLAPPDAAGWRFRDNMNAVDPTQRCEVLIARLPDGGYSFSVTQAGSCESNGGYGAAPQPNHKILFSARSREGELPRDKTVADAISPEAGGVSCETPRRGR